MCQSERTCLSVRSWVGDTERHSRTSSFANYALVFMLLNNELWKHTKQPRLNLQIRKCKWGWLGRTLRKPTDDRTRQALEWNPQGKWSRGRPKNTWRRTVLEEARGVKKTWAEIKCVAKNRVQWRNLVGALCSTAECWDYCLIDFMLLGLCKT